jgi:hypothetical protein
MFHRHCRGTPTYPNRMFKFRCYTHASHYMVSNHAILITILLLDFSTVFNQNTVYKVDYQYQSFHTLYQMDLSMVNQFKDS